MIGWVRTSGHVTSGLVGYELLDAAERAEAREAAIKAAAEEQAAASAARSAEAEAPEEANKAAAECERRWQRCLATAGIQDRRIRPRRQLGSHRTIKRARACTAATTAASLPIPAEGVFDVEKQVDGFGAFGDEDQHEQASFGGG